MTCPICNREYVLHPIMLELTCFLHGNPNGSELEQQIYLEYIKRHGSEERK